MNDNNRTITPFNSGAWREFLRRKLAHEGVLPLRLDQFGRCADCVERGLFRCNPSNTEVSAIQRPPDSTYKAAVNL
jgi:hypothetical protein